TNFFIKISELVNYFIGELTNRSIVSFCISYL
ncbi:unnamed protein product, partial [marine sediment metagenome]